LAAELVAQLEIVGLLSAPLSTIWWCSCQVNDQAEHRQAIGAMGEALLQLPVHGRLVELAIVAMIGVQHWGDAVVRVRSCVFPSTSEAAYRVAETLREDCRGHPRGMRTVVCGRKELALAQWPFSAPPWYFRDAWSTWQLLPSFEEGRAPTIPRSVKRNASLTEWPRRQGAPGQPCRRSTPSSLRKVWEPVNHTTHGDIYWPLYLRVC